MMLSTKARRTLGSATIVPIIAGTVLLGAAGTADAATARVATGGPPLNVRSGPTTAYPVIGQLANGSSVTITCWASGQAMTGLYGTETTWDQLSTGGYVADAYVYTGSNSPVVPQCASQPTINRENRAVAWANSMLGNTSYNGLCERFIERAYGTSGRYGSALSAFYALRGAGMMHYTQTGIPSGAIVFSRNPYDQGYGHVVLSRGDGTFVSPQSTVRIVSNPALSSAAGYTFLGWSYAPGSWPGR